ncbi:hypothetical protein E1A91_A07G220100v1 [Gossypium mustelinum]|uniref:RPA-interacting protein N-terminal domain-containing protein n=1 Tax=Gossypium mustelinum TaxID=34275 RepID=A0A5D2YP06_GOSMU|nr:hypothetical protein E1A91_A07G220100v1 [Gossypium mustelinum]
MEPKMEDTCPIIQRPSLKTHPRFNNYSLWKHKLRENCYKRVREDRTRLLWKMRLPAAQSFNHKEFINTAFQDIVSDELKKIKGSPISDCLESSNSVSSAPDELWEYSGLQDAYQGECEEILLEMQRIFYEDLRREPAGKEPKEGIESWEDEQDEYLARAVYEHMQLNDEQVNLDVLRDRLAEAHVDHLERGCRLKPKFCLETKFGLTALYILCQDCSTFEIVI